MRQKQGSLSIKGTPTYRTDTFLHMWRWSWPNDLDIRTWPRYWEGVPKAYQNQLCRSRLSNERGLRHYKQTQTDATARIDAGFVGVIDLGCWQMFLTAGHERLNKPTRCRFRPNQLTDKSSGVDRNVKYCAKLTGLTESIAQQRQWFNTGA